MAKRELTIKSKTLLTERNEEESNFFAQTVRDIPSKSREKFKNLKKDGKVGGSWNAFIVQAIIDKLAKES